MASKRQRIEDRLIKVIGARLLRSRNPRGGYLRQVSPYNGEVDRFEMPNQIKGQLDGVPAVLVHAAGGRYETESAQRQRYGKKIGIEFFLISAHGRNPSSRARSDVAAQTHSTTDPGVYQMEQDLHALLSGSDLGLAGVGMFIPVSEDLKMALPEMTVWRLLYTVTHDAHKPKLDHGADPLSSYEINANLDGVATPPNPYAEADGDHT